MDAESRVHQTRWAWTYKAEGIKTDICDKKSEKGIKVIHNSYPHTLKKTLNHIKRNFKGALKKSLTIIIQYNNTNLPLKGRE